MDSESVLSGNIRSGKKYISAYYEAARLYLMGAQRAFLRFMDSGSVLSGNIRSGEKYVSAYYEAVRLYLMGSRKHFLRVSFHGLCYNYKNSFHQEKQMKLIAGLGNPEPKYDGTRHNTGFAVLDALAKRLEVKIDQKKKKAKTAAAVYRGEKLLLAKPQTYMNLSGESVGPLADYYGVAPEDILVIVDDVALEPGDIRLRRSGSAGGHNGLKSVSLHLGTDEYPRLRVGVGEAGGDMVGHVLGRFDKNTQKLMDEAIELAADAALEWCTEGIDYCMNKYNRKKNQTNES